MVECSIQKVLPITLILTLLISMPVTALKFEESNPYLFPDLIGVSDISYLTPVGSSEGSMSSSSSTVIIIPASSQAQKSSVSSGFPLSFADKPPSFWIEGNRLGRFFDPLSRTSWQYDLILKKFYCPDKGWYLITRYSPDYPEDIIGQYYYDPVTVTLVDINTGLPIDPNTMEISSPLPSQTATITIIPTQGPDITQNPQNDPCQVSCPNCPTGSCRDCNKNQICDEIETGYPDSGSPSDISGQSEKPQDQVLPVPTIQTQKPTIIPASDGGQSENPQIFPVPTNTEASGGGQSESAQAPILAMQAGNKWSNENSNSTINNPKSPTVVQFENDVGILSISTYHENNGKGVSNVGTIGLKDSKGKIFGPWPAAGETGAEGEPNAIWKIIPTEGADNTPLRLEKGTYTILDSDEATWSNNAQSKYQGFCTISYMKVIKTTTGISEDKISISELNLRNLSI